ncbi:MAG: DNA polymerase III subunit alpha, partial [Enterococcus sp.]
LVVEQVYVVQGKVERSRYDQTIQLLVEEIELAQTAEKAISDQTLYLRVKAEKESTAIEREIADQIKLSPGNVPVIIYYEKNQRKIVLAKKFWIGVNDSLIAALRDILGEQNVVIR